MAIQSQPLKRYWRRCFRHTPLDFFHVLTFFSFWSLWDLNSNLIFFWVYSVWVLFAILPTIIHMIEVAFESDEDPKGEYVIWDRQKKDWVKWEAQNG